MSATARLVGQRLNATALALRAHAESAMHDHCRIEREADPIFDDATGRYAHSWQVVAESSCSVHRAGTQGNETTQGEVEYMLRRLTVTLPVSVIGPARGDRVTVTAVGPASDPALAGVVATVMADQTRTRASSRRLECMEVT